MSVERSLPPYPKWVSPWYNFVRSENADCRNTVSAESTDKSTWSEQSRTGRHISVNAAWETLSAHRGAICASLPFWANLAFLQEAEQPHWGQQDNLPFPSDTPGRMPVHHQFPGRTWDSTQPTPPITISSIVQQFPRFVKSKITQFTAIATHNRQKLYRLFTECVPKAVGRGRRLCYNAIRKFLSNTTL